jgi:predicted dehydrogenase
MRVKILGAGSIGNHLAHASRRLGWDVVVVDQDPQALVRMKNDIYPSRYGVWDNKVKLFTTQSEPHGGFDVICLGTPPDVRMELAIRALRERPKILQLEKPVCAPSLDGLETFLTECHRQNDTITVVGYDHAVAPSVRDVLRLLDEKTIGEVETLDVEFRENWQGIFSAHPWLSGPKDCYLGFWERGGGASGEHSHALHLWRLFATEAGMGDWASLSTVMAIEQGNGTDYDSLSAFTFATASGKVGRVIQDVLTLPPRKWARLQGKKGFIEWVCNGHPDGDLIRWAANGGGVTEKVFPKKRPDDFYHEMLHIQDLLHHKITPEQSPISLNSGVAVMEVLSLAHRNRNRTVEIRYSHLACNS